MKPKEQNTWTNKIETDSQIQRRDWWLWKGRGVRGWDEKGEGIKKYKFVVIKQSWGCKVQHRELIIITMYGAGWVLEILGGALCEVYDWPLCYIPNTK